ncbi:DgyrCDS12086 [Dimorphilus gyrociliatus]|nr:DgyrCDS12086 [Dimorphilus gyrociliatus]
MGSEITQDPFYDLIHPKFQSVRASVHVRSSIDTLREFFKNQTGIEIHLCSGDQSLGRAVIKLDSLIKPISTELYMKPLTVEGTFELEPPNRNKIHAVNVSHDSKPKVGASVSLRRLQDIKVPVEEHLIEEKVIETETNDKEDLPNLENILEEPPIQDKKKDIKDSSAAPVKAPSTEKYTPSFGSSESSPHHYCFSVNMKTLSELKSDYSSLSIRYSYPFFGVADPITSSLIEKIPGETEVAIPQGFCAFDFAALESQVVQTFARAPLKIELLGKEGLQTKILAEGEADLRKILKSQNVPAIHSSGIKGVRKLWNGSIELANKTEAQKSIFCKIMISLCLEDWGFLRNEQLQAFNHDLSTQKANARSTEEYKTALELEIWKERQKHKYEEQLREKERNRMEAITEEWKCREKERELLVKKKIAEYTELESQLRKTLSEVEKKERHLVDEEQSISKIKQDLQYEHDRKMKDIKDAWQRITEESEHKLKLERSKADSLREEISKLRSEIKEAENKYASLDKEFRNYKEQLTSKPECRLQSEINMLNLEKSELEKKLLVTTNAKVHYKQQWAKAINELARFRIKEQASAKHQLKKQHQELQQLKMRYLAAEESDITKSEKRQLDMIKEELNKLRVFRSPSVSTPDSVVDADDEHLSRLIEERDTLLQTGTYNSDDKIIMELEKQIRECISKHNR